MDAPPAPMGREIPLHGRADERQKLEQGLARARQGHGAAWVLQGPAGMGKTRLLRWLEHRGEELGFRTVWAYALQDIPSPFFLFDQAFARIPAEAAAPTVRPEDLPSLLLVCSDRPDGLLSRAERLPSTSRLLVISREMPSRVAGKHPGLPRDRRLLWLTRSEGPDQLGPAHLDRIGETVVDHLRVGPGGIACLAGLDYLVSQSSFAPVLKLVQYLRDEAEGSKGHVLLGLSPSTLAPRELALLKAEGEVEDLAGPSSVPVGPSPASAEEPASARLLRYAEVLEGVSKDRPLLMLLDDLQWADPQSLTAFQFLVRGLSRLPVVLASTLREEGPQGMPAELASALDSLGRGGRLETIVLGPLDREESESLGASLLPGPVRSHDREAWGELVARAGGNPYFVLETARYLLQEGLVHAGPGGTSAFDPRARDLSEGFAAPGDAGIPPAVVRMMRARLARLTPFELRLLRSAAVAGSHFPEAAVVGALGRPREEVLRSLETLRDQHALVEPDPRDPGTWEFNHPYVWEVVRATTPPEETAELAAPLAAWWARSRPHEVDQVARLFHDDGRGVEARLWCSRAQDRALRLQAGSALERYARWGMEMLEGSPRQDRFRWELRIRLGQGLLLAGEGARAVEEYRALLREDLPLDVRWEARCHYVDALGDQDTAQGAIEFDRLVADWPKDPSSLSRRVRLTKAVVEANSRMMTGRSEEAIDVARAALSDLPPEADPRAVCRLYDSLGWASVAEGSLDEARSAFQRGREFAQEHGLEALAAYHVDGLAQVAAREGRPREALELSRVATDLSRRAGDLVNTPIHGTRLAVWLRRVEGYPAALPVMRSMADLAERLDLRYVEDRVLGQFGWICLEEDDLPSAHRFLLGGNHEPETVGGKVSLYRSVGIGELQVREGIAEEGERRLGELQGEVESSGEIEVRRCWHHAMVFATALRHRPELAGASYLVLKASVENEPPGGSLRRWEALDLLLGAARVLQDTPEVLKVLALREAERERVGLPPLNEGVPRSGTA